MADSTLIESAESMSVVFVGHVDHGKSTVVGRLLADTGSLPQGKLEQVRANCERNSKPFEYAFLIDALKDEQSQGITIDAARVFFKSPRRHYLIIDAPGHVEFLKNMVTGASRAEAALLVIDAQEGIRENSRRHGYLLWLLGIRQLVVLVNKMDLVGYRPEVFSGIEKEYRAFLAEIGVTPAAFIPVSGREGDGVAAPGAHMPWYKGPTVLMALDAFEKEKPLAAQPFRLGVQDVYKFTRFGDERRIVAGRISSGSLPIGTEVVFYPSGRKNRIKSFEAFNRPAPEQVSALQSIGFTLEEQMYVQRGEMAARVGEPPPQVSSRLRVSLFWLGRNPMLPKKEYILKLGPARARARLTEIRRVMDAGDLAVNLEKQRIDRHEVAECVLTLNKAMAFDVAGELGDTGRFVIVDDYEICGGGIILAEADDTQQWVQDSVLVRNLKWEKSSIPLEQRAERYNQRATLVIITGSPGVGRRKIAKDLEAALFASGKIVYYLALGSVLYGVDADIKSKPAAENRQEHIRRLAEVAHILLDAGVILIVTARELTQSDLEIIKTVVDTARLETIWIGDHVTTDIAYDVQLPGGDQAAAAVVQIKQWLQDQGIIFSP